MTGPEGSAEGPDARDDETSAEVAPWRAPRWLVLAVPVVLVAALLVVRALLDGGTNEEAEQDGDVPAAAVVAGAEGAARDVLTAWSRPELDYNTWWAELRPMLTPRAREGYAQTDPRRIPALTVTGEPAASAGPTTDTVTIGLPTDGGTYSVALYRSGPEQEWQAVQILFPGQEGPFR